MTDPDLSRLPPGQRALLVELLAKAWAANAVELLGADADVAATFKAPYRAQGQPRARDRRRAERRRDTAAQLLRALGLHLPPIDAGEIIRVIPCDVEDGKPVCARVFNPFSAAREIRRLVRQLTGTQSHEDHHPGHLRADGLGGSPELQ